MILRFRFAPSCLLAATLALTACGSENSGPKPSPSAAPSASTGLVVGGKLGAAIASAEAASSAKPKASASTGDEPPENGIFSAEEAEKRQPKDAPPKLDLLGEGTEPRVPLALTLPATEQKTTVTIGMRMGQQMRLPTVDFALSIKPEKKAEAGDQPGEGAPVAVAVTVTGATLPGSQSAPKELADAIGKLKGMVLHWDLTPSGALRARSVEMPKDAGDGLDLVVGALSDALGAMIAPLPTKPVGKDAYWIVADRARSAVGLDVVRFRVFKVQSIANGEVTMSVDIRQYAADAQLKIDTAPGQKTDMPMEAFDSAGKGTLVWKADAFVPVRGEVAEALRAKVSAGQRGSAMVQTELSGQIGGGMPSPAASGAPAAPGKKP